MGIIRTPQPLEVNGTIQTTPNPLALDAGGALPVSQKSVLGNYVQDKDALADLLDRVNSGGASQTWAAGVVDMSVGVGEYAICQSFKKHLYLAGKAQTIEITFNNFDNEANVVKKVGYYSSTTTAPYDSALDGFYLEADGTTHNLVIYKNGTLIASVPRASWDDPMDGTGPSGKNIDFDNFTVAVFGFLYLGGTALCLSFNVGGVTYRAHTYENSSVNPSTFVGSPIQPVRWEIRSTTGTGNFGQICAAVNTGGALELVGYPRVAGTNPGTFINANSSGTRYLIAAIRMNNPHAVGIDLGGFALGTTSDAFTLRLTLNPTIAGTVVWNSIANSGFEAALGNGANPSNTTVTGGTIVDVGYGSNIVRQGGLQANSLFQNGQAIDGTYDVLALEVEPHSANLDVRGALTFKTL